MHMYIHLCNTCVYIYIYIYMCTWAALEHGSWSRVWFSWVCSTISYNAVYIYIYIHSISIHTYREIYNYIIIISIIVVIIVIIIIIIMIHLSYACTRSVWRKEPWRADVRVQTRHSTVWARNKQGRQVAEKGTASATRENRVRSIERRAVYTLRRSGFLRGVATSSLRFLLISSSDCIYPYDMTYA